MPLRVGVDAGGSRTIAAAQRGDETPVTVSAPPANANVCGLQSACETIVHAIEAVIGASAPAAIAVGAAGAGRRAVRVALTEALKRRFANARIEVTDDAAIALRGAVPMGDAVVLIAGTGSVAYGEIAGRHYRIGGGGYAIGDEGSGFAIGASALRLLLHALQHRTARDPLLDALAADTACSDAEALLAYVYGNHSPVTCIAGVAPIVLQYADAGERSAVKIVQAAALELFHLVRAVVRAARIGNTEVLLAFSGGLLARNSLLTYLIETQIAGELPHVRIVKDGGAPFVGALAQAARLLA